jgi:hydrogenase maturation factor
VVDEEEANRTMNILMQMGELEDLESEEQND